MAKKSSKKSTPVVFSATDVPLEKRNLIEASAGTGKHIRLQYLYYD
jgi:ATP-dependent exoDNAse (exonuclease V) beta subunit